MGDLIIPDMAATEDIDVARLMLENQVRELEVYAEVAELDEQEQEQAQQAIAEARGRLDAYAPPDNPATVTIGYLPARKRRELVARRGALLRGKKPADWLTDDEQIQLDDLRLDWIRWGVRAQANMDPVEWSTETVDYRGRQHQVVGPGTLDAYETMELLRPLSREIERWNTLSAQKKTRSSHTFSGSRETSTVGPASGTPD
jgi:hypothetical protein